jgi:hypothetical protein
MKVGSGGSDTLPTGTYDFEVKSAEDQVSRSGNEMIRVDLQVFAPDNGQKHRLPSGRTVRITDYLMDKVRWKLNSFLHEIGMFDEVEARGDLPAHSLVGKSGKVQVYVENDPEWGPRNRVKAYGQPSVKGKAPSILDQTPAPPQSFDSWTSKPPNPDVSTMPLTSQPPPEPPPPPQDPHGFDDSDIPF